MEDTDRAVVRMAGPPLSQRRRAQWAEHEINFKKVLSQKVLFARFSFSLDIFSAIFIYLCS